MMLLCGTAADMSCRMVMSLDEEEEESRRCYERYRILVQNECAGGELFPNVPLLSGASS